MNETVTMMVNRSSLRRFSDRKLTEEETNAILDAAMRAPTASNMMYYSIINLTDPELRSQIQVLCNNQPYVTKAPLALLFCADYQRLSDLYDANHVPKKCAEKGVQYLYPSEKHFLNGIEDAAFAAENAVIAAESMGMGSVYIGHIKDHYEEAVKLLNLPPLVFPSLLLLIGYPEENAARKRQPRFDKKYIVHENQYHRQTPEELEEMYKGRFFHTPNNSLGADNAVQQFYLNKFVKSPTYRNSIRSVHKMLENWKGAEKIRFEDE